MLNKEKQRKVNQFIKTYKDKNKCNRKIQKDHQEISYQCLREVLNIQPTNKITEKY